MRDRQAAEKRAEEINHKDAPSLTFEHVGFCYEGAQEDTLRDITLTVRPRRGIIRGYIEILLTVCYSKRNLLCRLL